MINTKEIWTNIESAIRNLPEDKAQYVRNETAHILRKVKPPKRILTKKEFKTIKRQNKGKSILILPTDKENATIVMNAADNGTKMHNLRDPDT